MVYGFQYHPEVAHTEGGMEMIKHFLVNIAGVKSDWTMDQVVEEQIKKVHEMVSARMGGLRRHIHTAGRVLGHENTRVF